MTQDDLSQVRQALEARKLPPEEIARILTITAPLFGGGQSYALAPAAEISGDAVAHALRTALGDDAAFDWRIVTVGDGDFIPPRHAFMTEKQYEEYRTATVANGYQAMFACCDGNFIKMLWAAVKKEDRLILKPTGHALPSGLEWARYNSVAACIDPMFFATPMQIRQALLTTFLDFALNGPDVWRNRLARIADLAAHKVIPYGMHQHEPGQKPYFLCVGA